MGAPQTALREKRTSPISTRAFSWHCGRRDPKAQTKNRAAGKPADAEEGHGFHSHGLRHACDIEKLWSGFTFPHSAREAWEVTPSPRPFSITTSWVKVRKLAKACVAIPIRTPAARGKRQELYWFHADLRRRSVARREAYACTARLRMIKLNDADHTEACNEVWASTREAASARKPMECSGAVTAFKAMKAARPRPSPRQLFTENHREGMKETADQGEAPHGWRRQTRDSKEPAPRPNFIGLETLDPIPTTATSQMGADEPRDDSPPSTTRPIRSKRSSVSSASGSIRPGKRRIRTLSRKHPGTSGQHCARPGALSRMHHPSPPFGGTCRHFPTLRLRRPRAPASFPQRVAWSEVHGQANATFPLGVE